MKRMILGCAVVLLSSCVYERTVTDSSGNVIYQEPEVHTPWESEEKKRQEVMEKEEELGWR
ncbi:MAG: hypothetical protein AAGI48_04835 [Verrucomicrobiota bacterium]